jgi:hypothetical protein
MDINPVACDMTFINTTLWGIPCTVIHGNTLSLQTWAQWVNIHAAVPFLHLLIPPTGQETPAATASEAAAQASAEVADVQLGPVEVLTPTQHAEVSARQGQPPTLAQLQPLREALADQLDFAHLLEDPHVPAA